MRSAFTTSTVVRMHVGDGKSSSAASRSSSLVNLWKRRGSTGETLRYISVCLDVCVCGVLQRPVGQVNAGYSSVTDRGTISVMAPLWESLWFVHV